jgi:hypothetical protein
MKTTPKPIGIHNRQRPHQTQSTSTRPLIRF